MSTSQLVDLSWLIKVFSDTFVDESLLTHVNVITDILPLVFFNDCAEQLNFFGFIRCCLRPLEVVDWLINQFI